MGPDLLRAQCRIPDQLKRLTASVRNALGRNAPILVDQEGGRVQRLGPPHWPSYPPGATYGRMYDQSAEEAGRAAYIGAHLMAADLIAVGIDVDCFQSPTFGWLARAASSAIAHMARQPKKWQPSPECMAAGLLWGVFCRSSSISQAMAAQPLTVMAVFPLSRSTVRPSRRADFAAFRPLTDLPWE